jgi:hypothetical protein
MAKMLATSDLYCLAITLRDSNPPIWRMIAVSSDTTLANFHSNYLYVRQYLGKRFNPAAFSKSNVNARLKTAYEPVSLPTHCSDKCAPAVRTLHSQVL